MKKLIIGLVLALALALGIWGGLNVVKPAARPSAEDKAFSDILTDIAAITAVPHVAGSPENQAVRDMLVNRAETLGFKAEVLPFGLDIEAIIQSDVAYYRENEAWRERVDEDMRLAGFTDVEAFLRHGMNAQGLGELRLDNVLVKISGAAPRGAAMFVAHYDSVASAPGAADDALAVACMLHLMEMFAQTPPQNDMYFLFTDGEELGLLGAANFVNTQPQYADEVDVLLNFEARGNKGAMLMFETSGNDYEMVRQYSQNVPQPVTVSVATAIYGMMPNGTDYTRFKNAGYHGLNFAMIEGAENYHQPTDTLENLDKDTAWQYYQTMAALGRHFAGADLNSIQNNQQAQYFTLPLVGAVVIPGFMGTILGFVPLALAALLMALTLRHKALKRGKKIARGIGLAVLGLLPCAVTLFFFAGSYLFSLPAILFLLADLALGLIKKNSIPGLALYASAVLLAALLFVPLAYLIYVALGLWYVTAIMLALPLIPTALYGIKLMKRT